MIFRNMLFVFQLIGKVLFYEVCFFNWEEYNILFCNYENNHLMNIK